MTFSRVYSGTSSPNWEWRGVGSCSESSAGNLEFQRVVAGAGRCGRSKGGVVAGALGGLLLPLPPLPLWWFSLARRLFFLAPSSFPLFSLSFFLTSHHINPRPLASSCTRTNPRSLCAAQINCIPVPQVYLQVANFVRCWTHLQPVLFVAPLDAQKAHLPLDLEPPLFRQRDRDPQQIKSRWCPTHTSNQPSHRISEASLPLSLPHPSQRPSLWCVFCVRQTIRTVPSKTRLVLDTSLLRPTATSSVSVSVPGLHLQFLLASHLRPKK